MMNNFKISVLILSVTVFLTAQSTQSFGAEHPQYTIKATIDTKSKTIKANEKVVFTNPGSAPLNDIYFHIYPNREYSLKEQSTLFRFAGFFKVNPFPAGFETPRFQMHKVQSGENNLNFAIEGDDKTILRVALKEALAPGESISLDLDFELTIPNAYGRLGWNQDVFALSRWYPILSVYDEEGWHNYPFYPFHRPFFSDAAHYKVELTVPQNQIVIHSGHLEKEESLSDGTKLLVIDSKQPIREFTLAMSQKYRVYEEKMDDVSLRVFYLPGRDVSAKKAMGFVKDMFAFYTERLGKYPYQDFSVAPVYLGYGGEQMSNLVFIDTRVYDLPQVLNRYFDFLVAHETGHQWLYNVIGIDEFRQIWLEEGVHSFFLSQYLEGKYGADATVVDFPKWFKKYTWILPDLTFRRIRDVHYKMLSRIGRDHQIVSELSSFQEPTSIFTIAYGKGSRVVAMLREFIGHEAFDQTFKRVYREYKFKNLSIENFFKIAQEESGKDLASFKEQWLYSDKHFDVVVDGIKNGQMMVSNNGDVVMPTDIKIKYKDGTEETLTREIKDQETIALSKQSKIQSVQIDPSENILDLDRTNNNWPRKINFKAVPLYWPLYDVPIFLPDDGYNLVVGPELANGGIGVKTSFQKPYEYNLYAASDYEFSENIQHSRVGYQLNNLFESQTALGFEIANRTDFEDGEDDLVSGKVFLRRELWPIAYGLSNINDHVSLYMIRNQGLSQTLLFGGSEEDSNTSYLKRNEAIVGMNLHLEKASPFPDPNTGYKANWFYENSGHFLGATQSFNRSAFDVSVYHPITLKTTFALRMKYGWGQPTERNLYELGGLDGMRGYDRKELRGSNIYLTSAEYRFPIKENLNLQFFDNFIGIESVGGVVFYDGGQNWYTDFDASEYKQDAGAGLRLTVNIGSYLEKVIVRADVAQAIDDDTEDDPHFWFGIGQAF